MSESQDLTIMCMLEKLATDLKETKKGEQPGVVAEFESSLQDYVCTLKSGNAVKTVSTASLTENRNTTDFAGSTQTLGIARPGQVKVGVSMGFTRNMGNFNSARFDANVETLADNTTKDIEDGIAYAGILAEAELVRRQTELAEMINGDKDK